MKARFLALAALVLGLASCQTEPEGLDVNVGGAVDTTITVSIPETETRANSAVGAFANEILDGELTMRYIMKIYDQNNRPSDATYVAYSDEANVAFDVRLVPNRHYKFVVWADVVEEQGKVDGVYSAEDDIYYKTNNGDNGTIDLRNITIIDSEWNAMNEERDAFTGVYNTEVEDDKSAYTGSKHINITLTRPFAKLRVVTTDMVELRNLGIIPAYATVEYDTEYRNAFDALAGKAKDAGSDKKAHTTVFAIKDYTDFANDPVKKDTHKVLFTDYFFANEGDAVSFVLNVYEDAAGQNLIKSNDFNTDIAVNRNYLTTIQGNVLTDGNNIEVKVEDAFENVDNNGNTTDPNYDYKTISSDNEFLAALKTPGKYIVISDLRVAKAGDTVNTLATRAANGKTILINLNGKTITVDNQSNSALVTLGNDDTLIFAGEGDIVAAPDSKNKLVDGGNVVVTGAAEVDEDAATVVAGIEALKYILANGGEFTLTKDIESDEVLLVSATEPVVINGANFSLTTTATRAIRVESSKANVTINDLNIVVATERVYPNDVRGISLDSGLNGVDLTLNNCSVDFTHKTANDWAYAVNVSGNGTDNKVTVNGGTYNGANVVNAHSAKNTIVVKNATLTSLYPNNDTYYGSCIWVLQNQGSTVYAKGNTFNGSNAIAFNLGTGTTLEEKDNIDNTMYYNNGTCYVGSSEKFQKAIAEGANNIVLGKGTFDLPSSLTQNEGTLTIIGAGVEETILNGAKNTNGNAPGNYANGVALEFDGLTFKTANNGYNGGFGHAVSVTFRESKIVGQFYAHSSAPHYFYNCTIDPLTGYLYTYGSDCVFEGCTFAASEGKALQIYEDGASGENTVTITNCAFVAAKQATTWDGKPVTGIDINSNGAKFEVYINNCTTTGFPTGLNSNSDLWNVKDAGKAHANVYVDGAQVWFAGYDVVANGLFKKENAYVVMNAEGLAALNAMMVNKTAGKAVKVTLGADIDFAGKTWTPVDSHVDTPFYFSELDGNGKTISNITINGQAMFTRFAGSGNVTIKNVTFDNAKVDSNGNINTSILTVQTYQNVLLDNVDVKNSTIIGGYKVAPLIATVYNEGASTITATLKNCNVENTVVKATSYDFCTAGMVAFVYEGDNDRIVFENCSVKDVQLYAPKSYTAHAAIYTAGSETLYNEAEGVAVENVTFENI